VIDSWKHQGITRLKQVRTIVETHVDAARNDCVEIECVSVMHRMFDTRRHL
jgi:hypothetical protein